MSIESANKSAPKEERKIRVARDLYEGFSMRKDDFGVSIQRTADDAIRFAMANKHAWWRPGK